jgi:hypothetical protein
MSITICLHTSLLVVPDEIILLDACEVQFTSAMDPILLITRNRLVRLYPTIASYILEHLRQHAVSVVLVNPVIKYEWVARKNLDPAYVRLYLVPDHFRT